MSEYIHIVCLDAPAPPDYGGAIDMYFKIEALAAIGKKIILHYFDYRPGRSAGNLTSLCTEVHRYKRKRFRALLSSSQPYIIASRINSALIERLNSDNHPILLEGLHCAGLIPSINNATRIVLRMHNEESNYYKQLAGTEDRIWKKKFFERESRLLYKYQQVMNKNIRIAALSQLDADIFEKGFGFCSVHFIPCFTAWQQVEIKPGKGNYCLYHGNLSVSENRAAVDWLLHNVFQQLNIPFVIAGKSIPKRLKIAAETHSHISVKQNPSKEELEELIQNAHVNILPSRNNTGVKLKLLHALMTGRFCITNTAGIQGSMISSGVLVADDPNKMIELMKSCFEKEFTQEMTTERKEIALLYGNQTNAQKLVNLLSNNEFKD